MNIQDLIQRVRNKLSHRDELSNEAVYGFLRVLEQVREEELPCEEIYAKLDEYVEMEVKEEDAAHIMPFIREHLDLCPECWDAYEALKDVTEKSEQD